MRSGLVQFLFTIICIYMGYSRFWKTLIQLLEELVYVFFVEIE